MRSTFLPAPFPLPTAWIFGLLLLFVGMPPAAADTLIWDADNGTAGGQDGTGTWTLGQPNWFNQTQTLQNQSWVNGSDAIFGSGSGTAGAVTLGSAVTVGTLTFNAAGSGTYTLSGNTLTLGNGAIVANASAGISSILAGSNGLTKTGAGVLTLSGGAANTFTGLTTVSAGQLALNKSDNVTAVLGDLVISGGADVTLGNDNQIASTSSVTMSDSGSVFHGTGPNAGTGAITQTLASLTISGGTFNAGGNSTWIVTGAVLYEAGANRVFVGNSGSDSIYGSLSLVGMNGGSSSSAETNGFTVFGNGGSESNRTTLTLGAGGLYLEDSIIYLGAGNSGSALFLNGDVSTGGTALSSIKQTSSGTFTPFVGLSGTAGVASRTFDVAGGGANLLIETEISNGAATSASLVKTGAGTLTLGGGVANTYTGDTIINQGTLTLNKTAGVAAVLGDIFVNSGGTLSFNQNNQTAATTNITVNGGALTALSKNQTFGSYTQNAGGLAAGGNNGDITVGTITLAGGDLLVINSGSASNAADWSIGTLIMTGADILVGGNSGTGSPITNVVIGSGGLTMAGRTITLNLGSSGILFTLNGDVTTSGSSKIVTGSGGAVTPLIDIGAATRTFNVTDSLMQVSVSMIGAGGSLVKQGAGDLYLTADNSFSGTTSVTGGSLAVNGADGRLSSTTALSVVGGASLVVGSTNTGNNNGVNDRINAAATLSLGNAVSGGTFSLLTPASGSSHTQTLESVTIAGGSNTISVLSTAGATTTLTFSGANPYIRTAGVVNFQQNPGDGGTIVFTNAPSGAGNVSGGLLIGATLNATDLVAAQAGVLTAFSGWIPTGTTTWTTNENMDVTGSNGVAFAGTNINTLRFNDAAAHTITLTGLHTIDTGMILVTPNVGANVSTLTGGSLQGAAGDALRILQHNTSAAFVIGSDIQDNTSATQLNKVGEGVLALTGTNTYTGDTNVSEGALRATDGVGLSSGSNLVLSGTGVFESSSATFSRSLGSAAGEVRITGGVAGFGVAGGPVAVNLGGAGATVVWGGADFNPTAFVLNGTTADNVIDFQNGLDLNGAARTVRVDSATQAATISGVISNSSGTPAELSNAGVGTLILSGNNTYDGITRVNNASGILMAGSDAAFGASIVVLDGGDLRAFGDTRTLANDFQVATTSNIRGDESLVINGSFTGNSNSANVTNSFTGGATLTLAGNVFLSDDDVTAGRWLDIRGGGTTVIDGVISNNAAGDTTAAGLYYIGSGSGTLTLNGVNTYTGRTLSATGGALVISADRNLGAVPTGGMVDSLILANGGELKIVGTFSLDASRSIGIGNSGGGSTTADFNVGTDDELTVLGVVADRTVNVDGTATGVNEGALRKVGNGVLTLAGTNTYTGATEVADGILRVASNEALGSTAGVTSVANGALLLLADGVKVTGETVTIIGGGATGPGVPTTNRGSLQADVNATAEWAGNVILGAELARIGVQQGGTLTVSGDISDGGNNYSVYLTGETTGNGGLILSGSNSWGGVGNTVRGTIYLGAHNTLPTLATLNIHYSASNNNEYAGVDLNGFNQTVGALQNTGNSGSNAELTNSSSTLSTFTVNQASDEVFNGIITGNLALVKNGAGMLTLARSNSFTGGTTVNEGILQLAASNALAEGNLTVNGGATAAGKLDLNNVSATINGLSGAAGTVAGIIANDSTVAATRTLTIGVDHASSTYAGQIVDNTGGAAAGLVALTKIGTGTQTLSGANTYTGTTTISNGAVIADFTNAAALNAASSILLQGAELIISGASTATIGDVTLVQSSTSFTSNIIRIQDGATITTGTLTAQNFAPLLLDLSGGGTFVATALSGITDSNGILGMGSIQRASFYVQDDAGIGFATQNVSNEIVRYTAATTMTASNSGSTTNFILSADVTRTANLGYNTIQIDTSANDVTLDIGSNDIVAGSVGRGVLVTGTHDATITGTTGVFSGSSLYMSNYGSGTLNVEVSVSGIAFISAGPGLLNYSHADNPNDLYVANGVLRMSGDRDYGNNIVRIYGGGVLEIGGDMNGAADSDFSRASGQGAGQVALMGNGGFSAAGADRVVALGGTASPDSLTWGSGSFMNGVDGDSNYAFKLGSEYSTHMLDFQNAINLGDRQRIVEVGDGTTSTNVDGRLSGVISGAGGSLIKTGAGTLELAAANTYSGSTVVSAGTLSVASTGSTGTGDVTVQSGGTILGTGQITGRNFVLENGATLHAGDGTTAGDLGVLNFTPSTGGGTMSLQGSVILGISTPTNLGSIDPTFGGHEIGSAGYLAFVNDPSRSQGLGTGIGDLLSFNTAGDSKSYDLDFLTAGGTLQITPHSLAPAAGQIFNLVDWASLNPNFTGFDLGVNYRDGSGDDATVFDLPDLSLFGPGLYWDVSQFTTSGVIVIVPEPGRMFFVVIGGCAALLRRRRSISQMSV